MNKYSKPSIRRMSQEAETLLTSVSAPMSDGGGIIINPGGGDGPALSKKRSSSVWDDTDLDAEEEE